MRKNQKKEGEARTIQNAMGKEIDLPSGQQQLRTVARCACATLKDADRRLKATAQEDVNHRR